MEFEWSLAEARREWPKITMIVGFGFLWTFIPPLWSGEKPWSAIEAGYAPARVLAATHRKSPDSHLHTVRFAYAVHDQSYTGEYACDSCQAIEHVRTGQSITIEYRRDDPQLSRPAGAMTAAKLTYWRSGAVVGVLLLLVGLAGLWVRHGKNETAEPVAANRLQVRR